MLVYNLSGIYPLGKAPNKQKTEQNKNQAVPRKITLK